jgi:two-component system cell cycle sensor histidine kinase/response regulator CckA
MGLSTVLGILRSHWGFIRVESKLGTGSTFSVYLPLAQGKKGDTEAIRRPADFQGNGELILVVDDDAAVRNSMQMLLEHLNFRVLSSASGHEALVSFAQRRQEIAAVLCDIQMPHMDGVVLVQALRRMSPDARIIVMSGNPGEGHVTDLKSLGVISVLIKPFGANQLVETFRSLFDKASLAD